MMKWLSSLLFPIFLSLILGGATFWLNYATDIKLESSQLDPNKAKYTIEQVKITRFDQLGLIKDNVIADEIWQFPENNRIHILNPNISVFDNGTDLYHATAKLANYDTESKLLYLNENVFLQKNSSAKQAAATIKTNSLIINTKDNSATTDDIAHYQYGDSFGSSQGLNYDDNQGRIELNSRVKVIINDPKQFK